MPHYHCPCFAAYIVWSYSTNGREGLQIGLLLVPRLLIQVLAAVTTASFLGWLLWFKAEPAEWRLKQFLNPEQYPTVWLLTSSKLDICVPAGSASCNLSLICSLMVSKC